MHTCSQHHFADYVNSPRLATEGPWPYRSRGWPLPAKALAVGVAFLVFKPLALAALVYFLIDARRRGGFRHAYASWPRGARPSGNSAFEERRRDTLKRLDEDAKAFDEFTRRQREAHDREAFDRFQAERGPGGEGAPKA